MSIKKKKTEKQKKRKKRKKRKRNQLGLHTLYIFDTFPLEIFFFVLPSRLNTPIFFDAILILISFGIE